MASDSSSEASAKEALPPTGARALLPADTPQHPQLTQPPTDAASPPLPTDHCPLTTGTLLRGYIDPLTSLLLSTETPNPPMPAGDKDEQLGRKPHSLGRLLPGLAIHPTPEGLHITGLLPKDDRTIILSGVKVDEHGFLVATV